MGLRNIAKDCGSSSKWLVQEGIVGANVGAYVGAETGCFGV